jgi:hypothetical protein
MNSGFSPMNRRNFLKMVALGSGAMVALTVLPKAQAAGDASLKATISANHGHRFSATLAELQSAGAKSYDIQGSSSHPHDIEITEEILSTLLAKKIVEIESSEVAGHTHILRLEII